MFTVIDCDCYSNDVFYSYYVLPLTCVKVGVAYLYVLLRHTSRTRGADRWSSLCYDATVSLHRATRAIPTPPRSIKTTSRSGSECIRVPEYPIDWGLGMLSFTALRSSLCSLSSLVRYKNTSQSSLIMCLYMEVISDCSGPNHTCSSVGFSESVLSSTYVEPEFSSSA